jgi:hypothetical protein
MVTSKQTLQYLCCPCLHLFLWEKIIFISEEIKNASLAQNAILDKRLQRGYKCDSVLFKLSNVFLPYFELIR